MTKSRTYHPHGDWTPDRDELIHANYGMLTPKQLAAKINSVTGSAFRPKAIYDRAGVLGLSAADNQGLFTLAEAARQLGVNMQALRGIIERYELATIRGAGKFRLLTDETWRALQAMFQPPPVPCIPSAEAARRLHYSAHHMRRLVCQGKVTGYPFGGRMLIPVEEVERLERIQRGAGTLSDLQPRRLA